MDDQTPARDCRVRCAAGSSVDALCVWVYELRVWGWSVPFRYRIVDRVCAMQLVCPIGRPHAIRLCLVRGALLCAWRLWAGPGTLRATANVRGSIRSGARGCDCVDACRTRHCTIGDSLLDRWEHWCNRK